MNLLQNLRQAAKRFLFPSAATYQGFGYDNPYEPKERDQRDSYRGAFYRCVEIRANIKAKAMLDAKVMRVSGQGEFEEVEPDHPWVVLKNKPNPYVTPYQTYWWMSTSMDLMGHANHIVLDVNGFDQPVSLMPIYVDFGDLNPVPNVYGGVDEYVLTNTGGQTQRVAKDQVVSVHRPSPFTPLETFSLIQAGVFELDTDKFMKMYRRDSVKDGGITSDIFSTPQTMHKEERELVSQELQKYKGKRGIDRIMTLSHGLEPIKSKMDMKDLQYIDGLIQNDKQLKYITGVPVPLFSDGSNRSVVEAAEREMIQYTIMPELELMCGQMTADFEELFGSEPGSLVIQPPDIKPLDEELEIRKRESYLRTGQRVINEYRLEDGKEEFEGGDVPLIQMGLARLDETAKEPEESPDPVAPEEPDEEVEEEEIEEERNFKKKRLIEDRERAWRTIDDEKKKLEGSVARSAERVFDEIERHVKKKLETREDLNVDAVFDLEAIYRLLRRILGPENANLLKNGFERGAKNAKADGLQFSMNSGLVQQTLSELAEMTSNIADTTKKNLSGYVQKQLADDEDVLAGLTKFFAAEKSARVGVIAQTMSNAGFEAGQQVAFQEAGVKKKEWASKRDGNVRETHLIADGQQVPIDTRFEIGSTMLRFPGDPSGGVPGESINCRCSQFPVG